MNPFLAMILKVAEQAIAVVGSGAVGDKVAIGIAISKLVMKEIEALRAEGVDVDRLLEASRAENERDIYEVLGIERPG